MRLTPLDPWIRQKINSARPDRLRQDLEAWQLLKLNETLALARSHSDFYRQHLAGMQAGLVSLESLRKLPFTTPDDLRRNPLQFVCVSQREIQRIVTLQTSGTTGVPKRIFFTADDQELTIDFFGVGMSTLTEPGERVLILLPCQTPGSVGDLLRQGLARAERIPLPYGPVRDADHVLETMRAEQPDCLVGSPTQVLGLARRWKPGLKPPRTVLLSTDYVPAAITHILEDTWGCRVFNHYGATEMGLGGGVECEAHQGYHLREADLYFEIIHPGRGEPVPDGEYGEVVFTTLTRRGMPLIRYCTGDRSRFLRHTCPCGTPLRLMECAGGRFSGIIPLGDGQLAMPDLDEALFPLPNLLNFTAELSGEMDQPILSIEAQMLTREDCAPLIERALKASLPAGAMEMAIRCRYDPHEPGSLLKRAIADHRGKSAGRGRGLPDKESYT